MYVPPDVRTVLRSGTKNAQLPKKRKALPYAYYRPSDIRDAHEPHTEFSITSARIVLRAVSFFPLGALPTKTRPRRGGRSGKAGPAEGRREIGPKRERRTPDSRDAAGNGSENGPRALVYELSLATVRLISRERKRGRFPASLPF